MLRTLLIQLSLIPVFAALVAAADAGEQPLRRIEPLDKKDDKDGARIEGERKPGGRRARMPLDVEAKLLDTDPVDQGHNQPSKAYTVKLARGVTYTIDMTSDDFDTYLRLEDEHGKQLAEDDDSGGELNAQIVYAPERDGSFKIIATRYDDNGTGAFHLRVKELTYANLPEKALAVEGNGLKVEAQLNANDPTDVVGPKNTCKVYSVRMVKGRTYTIEMDSTDFDTYLRLMDGRFKELDRNDDRGMDDLNSRITFTPTADGVYHIVATSFDGGPGSFTLNVREERRDADNR